jgi:glutamyl-tRNA synthetase
MTNVRVRYAPSPTGSPHIGNIRTALWDWLFARHTGGTFILRIEDTDQKREIPGAIEEIKEGLRWYGLDYDEGPDIGGPYGPYIQSQRLDIYKKHAEQLIAEGKAYYAYDTSEELDAFREQQQKRGLPSGYSRRHRHLSDEDRARYESERSQYRVVRLAVPLEGKTVFTDAVYGEITYENRVLDDVVLLKSDGYPTYHLAAQVDDHLMEISHVLRGEDWIPSAPLHILLYQAFGWEPPTFVHLPNMLGPDKKKFGKRNGALPALEYPKAGYLEEAMFNFTALQGWSAKEERDLYTREELVEKFDITGIINRSPISDPEKLTWYNGQYIRQLSLPDLAARTLPFLQEAGLVGPDPDADTLTYIGDILALEQERMRTLREAAFPTADGKPALADFFLLDDDQYEFDEKAVKKRLSGPGVDALLRGVRDGFAALDVFDAQTTEAAVRAVAEGKSVKAADVIHPVRVAVSGRMTGPGLFEMIAVLGRERCLRRLDRALGLIDEMSSVH